MVFAGVHVLHHLGGSLKRRRSADAAAHGDLAYSRLALEGAQDQGAVLHQVKARPVEPGQQQVQYRSGVGQARRLVLRILQHLFKLLQEVGIGFGFGIKGPVRYVHFPAPQSSKWMWQ